MPMELILPMPVRKKDEKNRPRACIVTSYSFRFKRLIENFIKNRYEQGTTCNIIRVSSGARRMLKSEFHQEDILDQLEESIAEGASKIIIMISATEGESPSESEKILNQIKVIIKKRFPEISIEPFCIRNDGLHGEMPKRK